MPERIPRPSLSDTQIAIATLLSSVAAVIVASMSIDDEKTAFTVTILVLFVILFIGCYFIFGDRIKQSDPLQHLKDRWNGPDMRLRHSCYRPFVLVGGVINRFVRRLPLAPTFWVSVLGVGMGVLVYTAFSFLSCPRAFDADAQLLRLLCEDQVGALAVISVPLLITWFTFIFSRALYRASKNLDPGRKTVKDFVRAFDSYRHEFRGKSIAQIRRDIAENDRGPVLIISVAATDLLSAPGTLEVRGYDVFVEAWKNNAEKRFVLLLWDPVSDPIVKRDKRLNGRYLQYYAIPYLRLLFKWREDEINGSRRISLRRWVYEPDFRVIMSKDRMVMQRYGAYQHGFRDVPVILHRVYLSSALDDRLSSIRCGESQTQQCALRGTGLWDEDTRSLTLETKSIFAYFANNFQSLVNRCPDETFIANWDIGRLQKFAVLCGLGRSVRAEHENWPRGLAEAICAHVGLGDEFTRLAGN